MIKEWELITSLNPKFLLTVVLVLVIAFVVVAVSKKFLIGDKREETPRPKYLDSLDLYLKHMKQVMKICVVISFVSLFGFMWFAIGSYFIFAGLCIFSSFFWLMEFFVEYHEKQVHPQDAYDYALKYQTKVEREEQEYQDKQLTLEYHLDYEKKTNFIFSLAIVAILVIVAWSQFDLLVVVSISLLAIFAIETTFAYEEKRALKRYDEAKATAT